MEALSGPTVKEGGCWYRDVGLGNAVTDGPRGGDIASLCVPAHPL